MENENVAIVDFTSLLKGFEKMWVVLSLDNEKIIASAKTLKELGDRVKDGTVMLVPDSDAGYVPSLV